MVKRSSDSVPGDLFLTMFYPIQVPKHGAGLRSVDEMRTTYVKDDALGLAHPWATIPWMSMIDSTCVDGRPCTTCVCSTNASLMVASRFTHT